MLKTFLKLSSPSLRFEPGTRPRSRYQKIDVLDCSAMIPLFDLFLYTWGIECPCNFKGRYTHITHFHCITFYTIWMSIFTKKRSKAKNRCCIFWPAFGCWALFNHPLFFAKFCCKFLTFLSFLALKMLKMTILTSVWSAQHPNVGQNIQPTRLVK